MPFPRHVNFRATVEIEQAAELYAITAGNLGLTKSPPKRSESIRALVLLGQVKLIELLNTHGKITTTAAPPRN